MSNSKEDRQKQAEQIAAGIRSHEKTHEKMSYDELNKTAANLFQENQQLKNQMGEMYRQIQGMQNVYNRLPFLFKILENAQHFSAEVVGNASEEIGLLMFPPEEESEETPKTE